MSAAAAGAARAGHHRPDGPEAGHAPTITPDHPVGSSYLREADVVRLADEGFEKAVGVED